ncbi:Hypothetical_protein [Hexamita inflata]|uniref:Hypothetical_protein n=1 Tax=Hexamita inflata TaxID=28002 RepID=A0ABP1GUT9_9EUKA
MINNKMINNKMINNKIDSVNGAFILIALVVQIHEKILKKIFSDSDNSKLTNIIRQSYISFSGISFIQGFNMHIQLNLKDYQISQLLKMAFYKYIEQQIPLTVTFILLSSIEEYKLQYCTNKQIYSQEFLQLPVMFGNNNQCGNIIHQVVCNFFLQLSIIAGYIMMKIVDKIQSSNAAVQYLKQHYGISQVKQVYIVLFISNFIAHNLVVMKISVQAQTMDLNVILRITQDAGSFYCGSVTAYYLYDKYPLQDIRETKIGSVVFKFLPHGIYGTIVFYSVILLDGLICQKLFQTSQNLINTFNIQRIFTYITVAIELSILCCDCKIIQVPLFTKISRSGLNFLLLSEIITFKIANSIGDIKIGPYNNSVIFLVSIGIIAIVVSIVQYVDYIWREILYFFKIY